MWDTIGRDIVNIVKSFFKYKFSLGKINKTFLVFIPKKSQATTMSDFRPISLCNVVYKIISKIIASRLKDVLPNIISPSQSAFLKGRLITDNYIIAHEVIHSFKTKKKSKSMGIKLDMAKAYDRMEWDILLEVLIAFGFSVSFSKLINECISSVTYSILLNGSPFGNFKTSRGIRQGDPLSPYLFILGVEVLSHMLTTTEERESFKVLE